MSRKAYWLSLIFVQAAGGLLVLAFGFFQENPLPTALLALLCLLVPLALWWTATVATTKRLHDHGLSGWWQLAPPAVGIVGFGLYAVAMQIANAGTWEPSEQDWPFALFLAIVVKLLYTWLDITTLVERGDRGANRHGEDPIKEQNG